MLIVYRVSDGAAVGNSGTNSARPRGPSFDTEVQNTINKHGGQSANYAGFRLHDVEDAETVQAIMGAASYELEFDGDGNPVSVTNIVERTPVEPEPQPNTSSFIDSLIGYFGLDKAEDLMRAHPTYVRSLDGQRWDIAQNRMQKMLADSEVTQAEYDDVQGMWDQFNLPRPE